MNIWKCDACGDYFEARPLRDASVWATGPGTNIATQPRIAYLSFSLEGVDLCQECQNALVKDELLPLLLGEASTVAS